MNAVKTSQRFVRFVLVLFLGLFWLVLGGCEDGTSTPTPTSTPTLTPTSTPTSTLTLTPSSSPSSLDPKSESACSKADSDFPYETPESVYIFIDNSSSIKGETEQSLNQISKNISSITYSLYKALSKIGNPTVWISYFVDSKGKVASDRFPVEQEQLNSMILSILQKEISIAGPVGLNKFQKFAESLNSNNQKVLFLFITDGLPETYNKWNVQDAKGFQQIKMIPFLLTGYGKIDKKFWATINRQGYAIVATEDPSQWKRLVINERGEPEEQNINWNEEGPVLFWSWFQKQMVYVNEYPDFFLNSMDATDSVFWLVITNNDFCLDVQSKINEEGILWSSSEQEGIVLGGSFSESAPVSSLDCSSRRFPIVIQLCYSCLEFAKKWYSKFNHRFTSPLVSDYNLLLEFYNEMQSEKYKSCNFKLKSMDGTDKSSLDDLISQEIKLYIQQEIAKQQTNSNTRIYYWPPDQLNQIPVNFSIETEFNKMKRVWPIAERNNVKISWIPQISDWEMQDGNDQIQIKFVGTRLNPKFWAVGPSLNGNIPACIFVPSKSEKPNDPFQELREACKNKNNKCEKLLQPAVGEKFQRFAGKELLPLESSGDLGQKIENIGFEDPIEISFELDLSEKKSKYVLGITNCKILFMWFVQQKGNSNDFDVQFLGTWIFEEGNNPCLP